MNLEETAISASHNDRCESTPNLVSTGWRFRQALIPGLILLASAACAQAQNLHLVGFNPDRGGAFALSNSVHEVRPALISRFPGVQFREIGDLTLLDRSQDDVVYLSSAIAGRVAITPLTGAEQAALLAFVLSGGGAVLFADNDSFSGPDTDVANESLIDAFGLDVSGSGPPWASPAYIPDPSASPISSGPFGSVSQFFVGWTGWFDNLGPYAIALGYDSGTNLPVSAYIPCGALGPNSGSVVLFSDSTMMADGIGIPDGNLNLVSNAIEFARSPCGCRADFNNDGGVDGSDVSAFFDAWEGGIAIADFNQDGGIDGADVSAFFERWEAGC